MEGGPAAARLNPPLFLLPSPLVRRSVQRYLRPGTLTLRREVLSLVRALSTLRRWLWLSSCRCWLGWLLSRHCLLVTRFCRAGALGQVLHGLRRFLRCNEALGQAIYCGGRRDRWWRLVRKAVLSASLILVRFNHKWCFGTTKLAMDPLMAWAVAFVACRARSVVLQRSQNETGLIQTHP